MSYDTSVLASFDEEWEIRAVKVCKVASNLIIWIIPSSTWSMLIVLRLSWNMSHAHNSLVIALINNQRAWKVEFSRRTRRAKCLITKLHDFNTADFSPSLSCCIRAVLKVKIIQMHALTLNRSRMCGVIELSTKKATVASRASWENENFLHIVQQKSL